MSSGEVVIKGEPARAGGGLKLLHGALFGMVLAVKCGKTPTHGTGKNSPEVFIGWNVNSIYGWAVH